MQELVIATTNAGKLREIKELLKDLPLKITSLADYPGAPKVEEDGRTFAQNALKKAVTIAMYTKKLTLGEDSGLEVKALGGEPGIHSARFSGAGATDKKNNAKLLRSLRGVPLKKRRACLSGRVGSPPGNATRDRQARYRCFAALVDAKGVIDVVNGSCRGLIALRSRGKNGFGYDPLFFLPGYNKTFGELDPAIKAKVSHRARALRKVRKALEEYVSRI